MGDFFNSVITGAFNFEAIGAAVKGFVDSILASPTVSSLWEKATGFFDSIGVIFPIALLVLSMIELFFGKKLIGLQRFLLCAVAGYGIGVVLVSPLINKVFTLPDYISGAIIALVLAVLCKFVYFAALAVAGGYSVYLVFITEGLLPIALPTQGNKVICAAIAAVAILVMFLLLKYFEMLGTSVLGAFFISRIVIKFFFDYRTISFIQNYAKIVDIVLIALVALLGFIVQVKTRKRY